jgi:type IV pilus secretin PilQ/predicted competence protein
MGSLVRKKKSSIFLTAVATILLVGLLSPPALSGASIEERKILVLEALGLDCSDPAVVSAAQQANTLYAVDVLPDGENISVVLQLSGLPSYDSYLYKENRRLVVDLRNTINLSPASEFSLGEEDPIRKVRNSQYRVDPSLISRVVLDLDENVTPEITNEGNTLVISAPLSRPEPATEETADAGENEAETTEAEFSESAPQENDVVPSEVVSVPAVEVDTETPEVDFMLARAPVIADLSADRSSVTKEVSIDPEPVSEEADPADTLAEVEEKPIIEEQSDPVVVDPDPVMNVAEVENEEVLAETPTVNEEPENPGPLQSDLAKSEAEMPAAEDPADVSDPEIVEAEDKTPLMLAALSTETEEEPVAADPPAEIPAAMSEEKTVENVKQNVAKAIEPPSAEQDNPGEQVEVVLQTVEEMEPKSEMPAKPAPKVAEKADVVQKPASEENLVTLTFKDAELSSVLDILARKGKFNILAGKDVRGVVTVRLIDVPLDVALNAILNVNGYGYIKTENIVRILPLSQLGEQIETSTETYTLSYASASEAKTTLQSFLTKNGNIETDERTNMLIVTDVPGNMDRIRTLIPQIDRRVQQVLIEVLILDSVLSDNADLGIQWNLFDTHDSTFDAEGNQDSLDVTLPFASTGGISLSFGSLINNFKLEALIQAVVDNTESRILANPKILTLNNEEANIEIIEEFPYNDVTQTSSGGQLSNITFKEIGTKLQVKPQITHDEHVILRIKPEQNFPSDTTVTGVPIIDTRRAETTLIVRNHQTIVLGGLRLNRKLNSISKVPLLGDLPGVKYAFRSVSNDYSDTELLVFITVHIVESPPLLAEQKIKFDELANIPRNPSASIKLVR